MSNSDLQPGYVDLTGEREPIHQTIALANDYGLRLGDDMSLALSINKSGLKKILEAHSDD